MTCTTCHAPITAQSRSGLCRTCANREKAAKSHQMRRHNAAARLEDVTWMAETGESLTGAAARLDPPLSPDALEKWLRDQGAHDVRLQLLARDPKAEPSDVARRAARTRFDVPWGMSA